MPSNGFHLSLFFPSSSSVLFSCSSQYVVCCVECVIDMFPSFCVIQTRSKIVWHRAEAHCHWNAFSMCLEIWSIFVVFNTLEVASMTWNSPVQLNDMKQLYAGSFGDMKLFFLEKYEQTDGQTGYSTSFIRTLRYS